MGGTEAHAMIICLVYVFLEKNQAILAESPYPPLDRSSLFSRVSLPPHFSPKKKEPLISSRFISLL